MKYLDESITGYIADRNLGTIVSFNNSPVWIEDWYGGFEFEVQTWDGKLFSVNINDLDFTPRHIGYVNNFTDYRSSYLSRLPIRQWKQGLRADSLVILPKFKSAWNASLKTEEFSKAFENIYPSYFKVLESIESNKSIISEAFSKEYCIQKLPDKVSLKYRAFEIGYINTDNGQFVTHNDFNYLKEELAEIIYESA